MQGADDPTTVCGNGRRTPAVLIASIEREACGRTEKPAYEFNYPADLTVDTHLWLWITCEKCGRQAKLHIRRELKPAH